MFFGIFQPRWKHSNNKIRKKTVSKLTDPHILTKVVSDDIDPEIRKVAISKLTDPQILVKIASDNTNPEIRKAAQVRYYRIRMQNFPVGGAWGLTSLHKAAFEGNTKRVLELIGCKAVINAKDCLMATPLDLAIMGNHKKAERALRDAGAIEGAGFIASKGNYPNRKNETPSERFDVPLSDNFCRVENSLQGDCHFAEKTVTTDGNNLRCWVPPLNLDEIRAAVCVARRVLERQAEDEEKAREEGAIPVKRRLLKDQYELLVEVGRGGYGAVYRARDVHLDQYVAIKELMLENPTSLKEEAKVLSELRHKNIVGFRQLFPEKNSWYLVMDFVEGGSLARLIHSKTLYQGAKEQILQQLILLGAHIAEGLNCAHEHGVIHQDVKPANVMVSSDQTAKVTDFGLAKARPQMGGALTHGGQSILVSMNGMTQAYCSPEQAAGGKLTKMTDIWSWGLLVMEMFVGEVTWQHGTAAPRILKEYKEKGIRDKNIPEIPRHLTVLLERCFEKEPKARPDMKEIIRILAGSQSGARRNWLSRIFK